MAIKVYYCCDGSGCEEKDIAERDYAGRVALPSWGTVDGYQWEEYKENPFDEREEPKHFCPKCVKKREKK